MVRTLHFHCQGPSLISVWGTNILQAMQHGQKYKKQIKKHSVFLLGWLATAVSHTAQSVAKTMMTLMIYGTENPEAGGSRAGP